MLAIATLTQLTRTSHLHIALRMSFLFGASTVLRYQTAFRVKQEYNYHPYRRPVAMLTLHCRSIEEWAENPIEFSLYLNMKNFQS